MTYQMEDLDWLLYNFHKKKNIRIVSRMVGSRLVVEIGPGPEKQVLAQYAWSDQKRCDQYMV
jgi:hypothetical protein